MTYKLTTDLLTNIITASRRQRRLDSDEQVDLDSIAFKVALGEKLSKVELNALFSNEDNFNTAFLSSVQRSTLTQKAASSAMSEDYAIYSDESCVVYLEPTRYDSVLLTFIPKSDSYIGGKVFLYLVCEERTLLASFDINSTEDISEEILLEKFSMLSAEMTFREQLRTIQIEVVHKMVIDHDE